MRHLVDRGDANGYFCRIMKNNRHQHLFLLALFALWCAVLLFRPELRPGSG